MNRFAPVAAALLVVTCMAIAGVAPVAPPGSVKRTLGMGQPKKHLEAPDYLPAALRPVLRERMVDHGDDLIQLVLAVTLLQRDVVRTAAEHLAREPRLLRPTAGTADDLGALLPARFFLFQDELRVRAKELSQAAQTGNDAALAKSFGRLAETCVQCHSSYLKGTRAQGEP